MLIEITYNVTDVYMSTTETPIYVEISFEQPSGSAAVWGSITGTLSNQTDLQNALNLKVPYTGATTNVNLGEYELKAGQVTLDTSPTGTAAVGTIRWNDTTGTSETTLKGGNVIIKNGVDLVARVVNKVTPNTTLTKAAYQAVRVSGAQGQRLAVAYAQANNDANSADTIGIVIETIPTNQEGFIMTVGQLEGINTTGSLQGETWVDGDVLYLSPTTPGALTNIKPTAVTGHIVVIGYVEYAHANNGKIYVKVMNGWELDELHNVSIVTPTNNQGLFYNSSNSLWENKSIATVLGYTPEQPLTFNSPLSRAGNVVSIPQATGSVNGFLSATDWTTFNSKQAALGYTPANAATTLTINGVTYDLSANRTWTIAAGISGTIATGQVAFASASNTIGGSNNLIWDNANSRLGIGTNAPAQAFDLLGDALITSNFTSTTATENGLYLRNTATPNFSSTNVPPSIILEGRQRGGSSEIISKTRISYNTFSGATLGGNFSAQFWNGSSYATIFSITTTGLIEFAKNANNGTEFIGTGTSAVDAGRFIFRAGGPVVGGNTNSGSIVQVGASYSNGSLANRNESAIRINPTINQTLTASGIYRGVFVDPALTSITLNSNWRSIDWSNNTGFGLYGSGTAPNFLAGNLLLNTTSDGGQRLQVYGDTLLRGSGATSATTALTVQNSSSVNLMTVRNDGVTTLGGGLIMPNFTDITSANNQIRFESFRMRFITAGNTLNGQYGFEFPTGINCTLTSGETGRFYITQGFAPTSGTAIYNTTVIIPVINQQGGANGITRGLLIAPTLTSAADFRAIETTSGKIVFGNLPTSSAGLPTGTLWNDAGTVKIV